jgi:hypothetical protein
MVLDKNLSLNLAVSLSITPPLFRNVVSPVILNIKNVHLLGREKI